MLRPSAPWSPATVAITAGRGARRPGDPVNVPPVLSSIRLDGGDVAYARQGNPTWSAFEEAIGALEGGAAVAFASGIAAIAAVLGTVPIGGVVVAPADAYTGFRALLSDLSARGRLTVRPVDIADTDATLAACRGAELLWVETPTNPMLAVADLPALCAGGHERGARVAVDNTFATPLLQRPLACGADVAVHSATKFIAGHSDLLLGVAVTADGALAEALETRRTLEGAVPGPFETWLALRGLRTLGVRLRQAQATAATLAERMVRHPAVTLVRYPGLAGDPGADRARRQMDGPGAIVSFEVAGGAAAAAAACQAVRLILHATSLGGVETSMERRARQAGEEGVPPGLIRLSVGCEDAEDLWADLDAALRAAAGRAEAASA
ncbi:MAG: trans-sulfuration enzyme family protein [Egibacteraceae bacterium]